MPSLLCRVAHALAAVCCLSYAIAGEDKVTHVSAKDAQKLIAEKNIVVLDVRAPEEFAAGHIAGATNINFRAPGFTTNLARLDKSKLYLVHCATGYRSAQALPILEKLQFQSIYHLDGGFKVWLKAGLPVER